MRSGLIGNQKSQETSAIYDGVVKIESYRNAFEFNRDSDEDYSSLDQGIVKQAEKWVNFISGNFCSDSFRLDGRAYVGETSRVLILYWRLRRILFHPLGYIILKWKEK